MIWRRASRFGVAIVAAALLSGCVAARSYRRAEELSKQGEYDAAVSYYRKALDDSPDRAEYRIALERAMLQASRAHLTLAKEHEDRDDLAAAVADYRKAVEFDGSNQQAALRATELEIVLRDRLEASRPKPPVEEMRERARRQAAAPLLNPASREPIDLRFTNASTQDILNFIGNATGVNIVYDRDFRPTPFSIQLEGVTLEDALNQIMTTNQLWYKVLNERTMVWSKPELVFQGEGPKFPCIAANSDEIAIIAAATDGRVVARSRPISSDGWGPQQAIQAELGATGLPQDADGGQTRLAVVWGYRARRPGSAIAIAVWSPKAGWGRPVLAPGGSDIPESPRPSA